MSSKRAQAVATRKEDSWNSGGLEWTFFCLGKISNSISGWLSIIVICFECWDLTWQGPSYLFSDYKRESLYSEPWTWSSTSIMLVAQCFLLVISITKRIQAKLTNFKRWERWPLWPVSEMRALVKFHNHTVSWEILIWSDLLWKHSSGPWLKREDWLKKKDRNQRTPGCRREKALVKDRVSSSSGPCPSLSLSQLFPTSFILFTTIEMMTNVQHIFIVMNYHWNRSLSPNQSMMALLNKQNGS